ncbi:MAG TPA: transposase, partial [Rhodoferax sp.]|nr:transposase [Rhodoferax sp.]
LQELLRQTVGIFFTKLKSNSKNRLPMTWLDRVYLRKRAIVETVIDQLKNISQIEHSRHRSVSNFMVNLVCGLIAYAHQPKKPSLVYAAALGLFA